MKKVLFLFMMAGLLSACNDSYTETITYQVNEPVLMSKEDFRSLVKVTTVQKPITNYGKICFYKGFLYISEPNVGIYILDNRNPAQPQNVGFIELPGNADIAVKNELLYADALIDLIWFDISNPANPKLKGRLENVFPKYYCAVPADNDFGYDYTSAYDANWQLKGIIVGWKLTQRSETVIRNSGYYSTGNKDGYDLLYANSASGYTGAPTYSGSISSTGINGSMSSFAIYENYLYTVINYYMQIFDIAGEEPVMVSGENYIGNVETIFSYKDNLFLGTPTGMSIYSVTNPKKPEYCSSITHVLGCDPVVVDNDLAYVTIRSGNLCGQSFDELFIVDVKDIYNPQLLVTYTMTSPKGLGIDSEKQTLFLCDDGLKIFKIGEPQTLISNQIAHIKGMDGFDLIPYNNVLMMIADNGFYQYDYSDLDNIKKLSVIPVNN
jgi:hypothetical protein